MLCSRADLLTDNVDLKHERKTKKNFGVDFIVLFYLYIKEKMKDLKKFISTTIKEYIKENLEKQNNLTDVILSVRDEFNCSYEEINQGKCVDFVDEVMDRFSGNFETLTTSMFVIDDDKKKEYLISTYNDRILKHSDIEWSKNMLDEYGYPNNELMDSEPPKHIWIYYNGKHYDAEEPNGVNSPWDLPIFDEYNWF